MARHRTKRSTLYRQGDINYLLTEEPGSHAARFAERHGPSVPSMTFRVVDAQHAYRRALELGAEPADPADGGRTIDIPAIKGIGGSCSTSSTSTARMARPMTPNSNGPASANPFRRAPGSSTSTT